MGSISETGHARNVSNFGTAITAATGWGPKYAPANAALKIPALKALKTSADAAMTAVGSALNTYTQGVNDRQAVFAPISKLLTRISGAVKSTAGVTPAMRDDLASRIRQYRGARKEAVEAAAGGTSEPGDQHSVAQLSYDYRVEHLESVIQYLGTIPNYNPDAALKVAALQAILATMEQQNDTVKTKGLALSNARSARNTLMYTPETGLVDVAMALKGYAQSIFETKATEYKQVSKLKFRRPNK